MSIERFTQEALAPLIGESISVCDTTTGKELTTLSVEQVTAGQYETEEFSSLSVILKGTPDKHLPQNTYILKHSTFGEVELFIVPNAVDVYQIIVSRKKA